MSTAIRRLGLCAALAFALSPLPLIAGAGPKEKIKEIKTEYFKGKVVRLADVLDKQGVRLDKDAAALGLALVGEDGKVYPLVKDDGGRAFWKDEQLLNRPVRLTGRLLPAGQLLQVVAIHSYLKGELHEVYYWCETCAIRRSEKHAVCECCGGPMELREVPVKE